MTRGSSWGVFSFSDVVSSAEAGQGCSVRYDAAIFPVS